MYYFSYIRKLVPIVESPKLVFGKGIHKGLEAYYRTYSDKAAIAEYSAWLDEQMAFLTQHGADLREASEMASLGEMLLLEYINFARNKDDFVTAKFNGAPAVEQRYRVPLWGVHDCWNAGTFDALVRDRYGKLWIVEHKTAQSFPSDLDLQLNWQVTVYILAGQQLFGDGVRGVIYNVIRKTNPKRARSPVIFRRLVTRTPHELKVGMEQIARKADQMLNDNTFDPNPGHWCNWRCAYQDLCLCLQDGTDPTLLINQKYTLKEESDNGADTYCFADEG